jgi:NAD-dependent dihydropyrimidine dehydrogenase PreA subunit
MGKKTPFDLRVRFPKGEKMPKIVINDKCVREKEKICVEICPALVFREGQKSKPEIVNMERCIMCRTCFFNCPAQAIEIRF